MRILRPAAAAVAVTAAVLVEPHAASAVRVPNQSLALSPASGPRTTSITATYTFAPQDPRNADNCVSEIVVFSWDGRLLSAVGAGQATDHSSCTATLTFTPPAGQDSPGAHRVQATSGKTSGTAAFIVTGEPAPVPPTPSASPVTPANPPTTSASPAHPGESPSRSAAVSSTPASESAEALPSEIPSFAASPAIVGAAMKPPSGISIGMIIAIIVGALTIAGAGLLIGLAVRNRPDADEACAEILTAEP